jgi:hypothetical protein
VVEVGKPKEDGAAVSSATNQEDTKAAPMRRAGARHVVSDFHVVPFGSETQFDLRFRRSGEA